MHTKRFKLTNAGMFSSVNRVIYMLSIAEKENFVIDVDWSESCYKDASLPGDPWSYYFEDCFDPTETVDSVNNGSIHWSDQDKSEHIVAPQIKKNGVPVLLLPKNRALANYYIKKYLRLKSRLTNIIDEFKKSYFKGYTIGVHLRGPGRLDGGVRAYKNRLSLGWDEVPFDLYFNAIDKHLKSHPEAAIFLCSDSQMVIDQCRLKYKNRIITYTASRSDFGEMHNHAIYAREANQGQTFSNYKLGADVIVEAYLLSATDFLIHGSSNVTNFVLCNNPDLNHFYVFKGIEVKPEKPRIKLLVCSFGGVGSKCLVKGLLATDNKLLLNKAHAHRRRTMKPQKLDGRKIIYIFGDPLNAVISFFNRRESSHELHNFDSGSRIGSPVWVVRHCRNLKVDSGPLTHEWDLDRYAENGEDLFHLEEHFDNWTTADRPYPILLVKFETMWNHLPEIFRFCGLPKAAAAAFPLKQTRASNWRSLQEPTRSRLLSIYGCLQEKINDFPELSIIDGGSSTDSSPNFFERFGQIFRVGTRRKK